MNVQEFKNYWVTREMKKSGGVPYSLQGNLGLGAVETFVGFWGVEHGNFWAAVQAVENDGFVVPAAALHQFWNGEPLGFNKCQVDAIVKRDGTVLVAKLQRSPVWVPTSVAPGRWAKAYAASYAMHKVTNVGLLAAVSRDMNLLLWKYSVLHMLASYVGDHPYLLSADERDGFYAYIQALKTDVVMGLIPAVQRFVDESKSSISSR